MKRAILLIPIIIAYLFAVSYTFADEGDTEAPATVAPAIIQAPPASETPAAVQKAAPSVEAPRPVATSRSSGKVRGDTTLRETEPEYIVGNVSNIVPSGIMQPTSRISITDQNGSEIEFSIKPLAVIYDKTGTILSLDNIQQGTKVQVNYKTTGDNKKVATAIKILK